MAEQKSPHELIREYYPLEGIVGPLVELVRVNPEQVEAIVELAMLYGIHAAEQKALRDAERETVLKRLDASPSYHQTIYPTWGHGS